MARAGRRGRPAATDTTLRTAPEPFPWLWAVPAVAITAVTAVVGALRYPHLPPRLVSYHDAAGHPTSYTDKNFASAFGPVMAQIGISVLIVALARITARGKAALDVQDPHAAARHRRFVAAMARCVLVLAAAADLSMFFGALALWKVTGSSGWFVALLAAPIVVATAGVVVVTVRVGQGGSRLRFDDGGTGAASGASGMSGASAVSSEGTRRGAVNRDDDRYWRLGMLYFNREDPAVFVPKRFGVGWTLNFARPTAVAFLGACVMVPLLIGLIGSH